MDVDETTAVVVDTAYQIHRGLGPGLLESVYVAVLGRMLEQRGLKVLREKVIAFEFAGLRFEEGYRLDLLVEDQVVVEVKSVEQLAMVHPKQLLTYLRLMNLQVGLMLNFSAPTMRDGIKRVVNGYIPRGGRLPRATP